MACKITKKEYKYQEGQNPDVLEEDGSCRFLIGKKGCKPLVAVCMNPSVASKDTSDWTVNRIISISKELDYKCWFIVNTYPERATCAETLGKYDKSLAQKNTETIKYFLCK